MKKKIILFILITICLSCKNTGKQDDGKFNVVTTTSMITDLTKNIEEQINTVQEDIDEITGPIKRNF